MAQNTFVPLSDAIASVREELLHAMRSGAGHGVVFELGPVELEFTVELQTNARHDSGVRVMVLANGGGLSPDKPGQHRIRLELTPKSTRGEVLSIGAEGEIW